MRVTARRTSRARGSSALRLVRDYAIGAVAAGVVAFPLVVEQAVERVRVDDYVGTLPVAMSLCRQGRATLETGVLGDIHWEESGPLDFGVRARVTGPPRAAGTSLASYADRRFIRANVQFIEDPDTAVAAYVEEFRSRLVDRVLLGTGAAALVGGVVVVLMVRGVRSERGRRRLVLSGLALGALAVSATTAWVLFDRWPCNGEPDPAFAFPTLPQLSFSSPQTREIALQVQPFIEKNTTRLRERAEEYEAAATASFADALVQRGEALLPRDGEVVVSAEADPQGAIVGTQVRKRLYELLVDHVGDGLVLRTISGDITSNGTVAEDSFVAGEAQASGDVPTAAVGGDHDSEATWEQMRDHGMVVPDLSTEEVGRLRVSGANDVEHKALFGQLVRNDTDISERGLGERLREEVDDAEAGIVLLHQPEAVSGYLGVDTMKSVRDLEGSLTEPSDDGIPDVPPGTVNVGHLHDLDGPWVLWNTDGDEVTWTVVDQLGTTGGVEESSTFNRFSTPISVPLKAMSWRLQYFDERTGLQTGFATVLCDVQGECSVSERTDVGVPFDD